MTVGTLAEQVEDISDVYLLNDKLSESEREVRARVRGFVETELLPVINHYWEEAAFPFPLVPKVAELGIGGTVIQGYGCPGMSRLAAGIIAMEVARGDGSFNTFLGVHSGLAMGAIDQLGSEEQKQRWLPAMAQFEKIGAFGLTEPNHGSDSVALETSARRDGNHYVLNGYKRWIGNASMAEVIVIWARDEADSHVKGFVVERNDDGTYPQGYSTQIITGKIGKRAILQPDITIDNLRVPADNRLAYGQNFKDVSRVLAGTRTGAAWESMGHAVAAYEIAVAYAKKRIQFGKPIATFQLVQNKLANMLAELTAMKMYCFHVTELAEAGAMTSAMASLAKMHTAQKARWVCSEARDILGGNGVLLENHVARHLTDMEVVSTYEGTDSIQSLIVGRDITGISAFK